MPVHATTSDVSLRCFVLCRLRVGWSMIC
jgi:hypothetical protein